MKIGIFTVVYNDKPLGEVAEYVSKLGYEMVELPAWKGNNHLDIEEVTKGKTGKIKRVLKKHGLEISAIGNHLEGQLVLGPHDESTDPDVYPPHPRISERRSNTAWIG